MHFPGRNTTDPIWKVLASSDGISSWTPLKPQHSTLTLTLLANQLWSIDFLSLPTPLIIPHRLDSCKMVEKQSEAFHSFLCHFFPSLKQNFTAYLSSKVSDCIFEIHQQWQSGFSRVYSNCCYKCSFEPEIIKIGQLSYKMYSNKLLNFQESTTIQNAHTKKVLKLIVCSSSSEIRYGCLSDIGSSCHSYEHVDITFRRWDIAIYLSIYLSIYIYKLVY